MNIGSWVTRWARLRPQQSALIHEGRVLTYLDLNERVNRVAHVLLRLGLKKGERIGVLLNNCNQYIEIFLALSKIGGILVPLNTRLAKPELTYILNDSGSSMLVFEEEFTELVDSMKKNDLLPNTFLTIGTGQTWALDYEKSIRKASSREVEPPEPVGGEDPHIIMYTSGTTGLPKGAILSHRKTFFNALNADIYYGLTPEDVLLVSRALFHSGGLLVEAAPILYKGGTMVMKRRFKPQEILEAVERYRVSVLEAPATVLKIILEQCDLRAHDLRSLKCCFTGGERVPPSLLKDYQERGIPLSQIYGQTETSTITWLPFKEASRKRGSVGIPVFHGDVKVFGKQGREAEVGEIGEIVVKGYITMSGYWGKPDLTAKTIREGWLHTGDLATMDEEGFIYIVDREKDMFISGGENVYPAEVEKLYLENPRILNVAVVGVPDEKWGEVGAVFIVLKENETMTDEEALRFCDGRIARYKMPKHVRFVKDLPMTAAQKIMRNRLRQAYLETSGKPPSGS